MSTLEIVLLVIVAIYAVQLVAGAVFLVIFDSADKFRTRALLFFVALIPLAWTLTFILLAVSELKERRAKAAKLTREINNHDQGDAKAD